MTSSLPPQKTQNIQQALDLAVQLHSTGRLSEAEEIYSQILQANPTQPVALHLLGVLTHQLGMSDKGVDLIKKSLAIKPDYAEAHNNLGNILEKQGQGKRDDAVASYRKALAIQPDYAEARYNLANALKKQSKLDEAVAGYREALAIKPDYAKAYFNLGNALKKQGKLDDAIASYREALAIKPDDAEFHNSLGVVLEEQGKRDDAVACFREALSIKPDYDKANYNMGTSLMDRGRTLEAATYFNRALHLNPGYDKAHSNLIFLQDLLPDVKQAQQLRERQRWNENFIIPSADKINPHTNDKTPDRRLRIGYVSGDFYRHSASQGFSPLIMEHDRDGFDVICYDNNPGNDEISHALRSSASDWRETRELDDDALADIIREDAIDILVDLSGHTRDNRLKMFAQKPAPIQVTGIGHLAPGLNTIDYRLTTPVLTPPEEQDLYPEQPIYLKTFFGLSGLEAAPAVASLPCLKNGFLTFGFLGRHTKITTQVIATWARILADTPGSRLLLKHRLLDNPQEIEKTRAEFSAHGISEDRLDLLGTTDRLTHLAAHNNVDIVLDTFPHGGGITALESLWMGTPLIGTHDANKVGGRIASMIMAPLDLGDWVVNTPGEYIATAVSWQNRMDTLSQIREELRPRLSKLYGCFTRDVEAAYVEIWSRWCRDEQPSAVNAVC